MHFKFQVCHRHANPPYLGLPWSVPEPNLQSLQPTAKEEVGLGGWAPVSVVGRWPTVDPGPGGELVPPGPRYLRVPDSPDAQIWPTMVCAKVSRVPWTVVWVIWWKTCCSFLSVRRVRAGLVPARTRTTHIFPILTPPPSGGRSQERIGLHGVSRRPMLKFQSLEGWMS